jgi:TctA family transporter
LLLGFILGPMMEENLRRALLLSRGDWMILVYRPVSAAMLALTFILIVLLAVPFVSRKRSQVFVE